MITFCLQSDATLSRRLTVPNDDLHELVWQSFSSPLNYIFVVNHDQALYKDNYKTKIICGIKSYSSMELTTVKKMGYLELVKNSRKRWWVL